MAITNAHLPAPHLLPSPRRLPTIPQRGTASKIAILVFCFAEYQYDVAGLGRIGDLQVPPHLLLAPRHGDWSEGGGRDST